MILEIGRVIAERYEITEKIGSGGMSIVYKAMDKKLNRSVSLKVLREEYSVDEEFRKRFIREARSVASLNHQNIVNVYDVGQEIEINFIVMEFIAGMTLKELINKRAPFSEQEVLGVAIQIASALIHAHNNKIIHRDIKPHNVIVTGKGVIKVADFGIARKTDSNSITMGGSTTMGSVHYFSPEQAKGVKADPKSDLYSLGIVMFEMLTGELPFDADTAVSVALMQINEPLPDVLGYNPELNLKIKHIVEKLTEKNPEYRYQSAEILLKDLRAIIANPDTPLSFDGELRFRETAKPVKNEDTPDRDSDYGYGLKSTSAEYDDRGGYDDYDYEDLPENEFDEEDDRHDADDGYIRSRREEREAEKAYTKSSGHPPRDVRYKRRGDNKDKFIIFAAVAAASALVVIAMVVILPRVIKGMIPSPPGETMSSSVTVPDIDGIDYETAKLELESLGLSLKKIGEQHSETVAAGNIIIASQDSGDSVLRGTVVEVIVSLGTSRLPAPDLIEMQYSSAYASIRGTGFRLLDEFVFDDTHSVNTIIDQNPKPGDIVERDAAITIYISKGKEYEKFSMTKLTGMNIDKALSEIEKLRLKSGSVTYRHSETVPKGEVMEQTISPGKEVIAGNSVGLIVSDGPAPVSENNTGGSSVPGTGNSGGISPNITPLPPGATIAPTPTPVPTPEVPNTYFPDLPGTPAASPTPAPYIPPVIPDPTTTPVPTPAPTPVPTPVIMPTKPPTTLKNIKSGTITIDNLYGHNSVNVRILTFESGANRTVFEMVIDVNQLPVPVTVYGEGTINYTIYVGSTPARMVTIDFN